MTWAEPCDDKRFQDLPYKIELTKAGRITDDEISAKKDLYLEAGATEVWLCDELGRLSFFTAQGPIPRSRLCPEFPLQVGTLGNGA